VWFRRPKSKQALPIRNKALLEQALTHRSYTEGNLFASNERLEFLGDAVLGFIITEYLHEHHPDWDQGQLSKAKSGIVRESTLAQAARRAGLAQYLRLSASEEASGGQERASILSDTFEAVLAAIYLDRGLPEARKFAVEYLQPELEPLKRGEMPVQDYKSQLQEAVQAWWKRTPTYHVIAEQGSPHMKTFIVEVQVESFVLGTGTGASKKQAEQDAAARAMENIQHNRRLFDEAFS
jgi:ribonuclease-3